jgi:hypothetical protein
MRLEKAMRLDLTKNDKRPHASGRYSAPAGEYGQSAALRCQYEDRFAVPASGCKRAAKMSDAWWGERLRRAFRYQERQLQARRLHSREPRDAPKSAQEDPFPQTHLEPVQVRVVGKE